MAELMTISRRDSFLDSLRGVFHVVMLMDHLPFILPGMFAITGSLYEGLGYVTVAEGFVFLSGYVSGLVYTRAWRENGVSATWRKALVRARDIYLCYILAVVLLLALVKVAGSSQMKWGTWGPLLTDSLPISVFRIAFLLRQPTFLEILPMYSALLLVVPILVGLLERGRWVLVCTASLAVWIAAQFDARQLLLRAVHLDTVIIPGYFNAFGWQILFISGLMCGYKTYAAGGQWLPHGWKLPALAYLIVSILFMMRHGVFDWTPPYQLTTRLTLGPLRLLNFFAAVFLLCKIRPLVEKWIAWRGFAFLSKHSLQVFAFHLFPVYLAALVIGDRISLPWWGQLLFVLFCLAGLFYIAFLAQFFKRLQGRFGIGKQQTARISAP